MPQRDVLSVLGFHVSLKRMEHHRYIEYFQSQVIQAIPAESRPGTEVGQLLNTSVKHSLTRSAKFRNP